MLLLRVIGFLTAVAIGAGVFAFLVSGQRRYLGYSWRIAKYALMVAVTILVLMALERILVI